MEASGVLNVVRSPQSNPYDSRKVELHYIIDGQQFYINEYPVICFNIEAAPIQRYKTVGWHFHIGAMRYFVPPAQMSGILSNYKPQHDVSRFYDPYG